MFYVHVCERFTKAFVNVALTILSGTFLVTVVRNFNYFQVYFLKWSQWHWFRHFYFLHFPSARWTWLPQHFKLYIFVVLIDSDSFRVKSLMYSLERCYALLSMNNILNRILFTTINYSILLAFIISPHAIAMEENFVQFSIKGISIWLELLSKGA